MRRSVPVLMYHALESDNCPCGSDDPGELVYVVNVDEFKKQINYLYENGYKTITSLDILANDSLPEKPIMIGFDDGHESNYTMAMPILNEYGFKAEIYITTGWIGSPHYLASEQIIALYKNGMVIGSHGETHRLFNDLSEAEIIEELVNSKSALESIIGEKIVIFAAPGGRYNEMTLRCLKDLNYKVAYTSDIGVINEKTDKYKIPRIAIKKNTTMDEFKKIAAIDKGYIYKKVIFGKMLNVAKRLLGNRLYTTARNNLVK